MIISCFQDLKWDGTVLVCLHDWTGRRALTLSARVSTRCAWSLVHWSCSWCWTHYISWTDDCGPLAWCLYHRFCAVSNQFESKASSGVHILDQPPNCHHSFLQFVFLNIIWFSCELIVVVWFIFFLLTWVVLGILSIYRFCVIQVYFCLFISYVRAT